MAKSSCVEKSEKNEKKREEKATNTMIGPATTMPKFNLPDHRTKCQVMIFA
jgi:hypothetical protein